MQYKLNTYFVCVDPALLDNFLRCSLESSREVEKDAARSEYVALDCSMRDFPRRAITTDVV